MSQQSSIFEDRSMPGAGHSPLRILTVADVPPDPNSGAAGTVYATNVALRELGHTVHELWADQLGPRRIRHGNLHSLLEQPRAYRREVIRAVGRHQYDVVMMSQPQAYLAAKALRRRKFPGVIVNRSHGLELRVDSVLPYWHRQLGIPESRFPRSLLTPALRAMLHRQWDQIVRSVDAVVVPCSMDAQFLMQRYGLTDRFVRTIHHGVSDAILGPEVSPMTSARQKKVLHVGQFAFFKGPYLVARIMNTVMQRDPDVTFTWVTSNSGCDQAAALLSPQYRSRITLIPWTTQQELVQIFDQHGIFLFPTLCEGAAKSSLEAMARGLCVVGSDDSGMRDYITSGTNGFLCPVGDVGSFQRAIVRALKHHSLVSVSNASVTYARAKSWTECGLSISSLFAELLKIQLRSDEKCTAMPDALL